jgi:hypothetical protein
VTEPSSPHRYYVTSSVDDRSVTFQQPIADPFVRHTVYVHWRDLLRSLMRGRMEVTVSVGADRDTVDAVLGLDPDVRPIRPRVTLHEPVQVNFEARHGEDVSAFLRRMVRSAE